MGEMSVTERNGDRDSGDGSNPQVKGIELQQCPVLSPSDELWIPTYGTVDCDAELMREAWQRLYHCLSVALTSEGTKLSGGLTNCW